MEQVNGVSAFIAEPPSDPMECIAHNTGRGVKLPKITVDITETSLKRAAK